MDSVNTSLQPAFIAALQCRSEIWFSLKLALMLYYPKCEDTDIKMWNHLGYNNLNQTLPASAPTNNQN